MSKLARFATTLFVLLGALYCNASVTNAQIAPGVQQPAAQTATISGVVARDTGARVSGATVSLTGPSTLITKSDAQGQFRFVGVPFGSYQITATSDLGVARQQIALTGDLNISIRYAAQSANLRTIASITTRTAGAHINVTPASIASVSPSAFAFQGNLSWRELLSPIPGVSVGGGLSGGGASNTAIPSSPFQPIILSINGALPYETATTFDGMPLSSYSLSSSPGGGVDLSPLPMALFDTADIVRGPGANAPSIVDSAGGSFVLHPPGPVAKNSFESAMSTDAYGGYNGISKLTYRLGKLSATMVYGMNNSPGPWGSRPSLQGIISRPLTINGTPVASGGLVSFLPNPVFGNCFCNPRTTLFVDQYPQSTNWTQHDGGIGLAYQAAPNAMLQVFYAGSQSDAVAPFPYYQFNFAPSAAYSGPLSPGDYRLEQASFANNILQSASITEEKATINLGRGVLRLAALQNNSYTSVLHTGQPNGTFTLYGSGAYCNNPPSCSSTTPFAFNGTPAALTFASANVGQWQRSYNDDLLASYETELGVSSIVGISYVKSGNYGAFNSSSSAPGSANFTTNEVRLHVAADLSRKLSLDGSYYFTSANYHVPDPNHPTQWVDVGFPYSAPRVGAVWHANSDLAIRASAGGGFALPPLFNLVGVNQGPRCNSTMCLVSLTNINLQPEKSFGFDFGADARLRRDTALSVDIYRTNLYGQLFQSVNFIGLDPSTSLPTYAQEYVNIAQSRFEGVNLSLRHDVPFGAYWGAQLGLNRGYIVSVPASFYNALGATCNFSTGTGCQNTYAIVGQNFNGKYQSTVPYANGEATVGYRWAPKKFVDVEANYYGNDNVYFVPAFMEFNARLGYSVTKNFSLIGTVRNFTGIHDSPIRFFTVDPNWLAPSAVGGPPNGFVILNPVPFGPRTFVITADISL